MPGLHYKPKKISEIDLKSDSRISLVGNIVSSDENGFVLEDKSGKTNILSDMKAEPKKTVRVFCSVAENQLKADVIQNLNGFDTDLFNRVEELYRKKGV